METESMTIKQEPADDSIYGISYNLAGTKRKASEDFDIVVKRSSTGTAGEVRSGDKDHSTDGQKDINANSGKFQCLICDAAFSTDEDLTSHLSVVHKHFTPNKKFQSRFARHTCQVCFAKFRTLKDFFNHTSCHAVQPGLNNIDREISAKVASNISKNALQHYFRTATASLERELLQPSFRCECCNTVFLNRDSYAMHVMMRVKNEACRQNGDANSVPSTDIKDQDINLDRKPDSLNSSDVKSSAESPDSLDQAYYVDVTTTPDRDEYLMSVLGKADMAAADDGNAGEASSAEPETSTRKKCASDSVVDGGLVLDAIRSAIGKGKKCFKCDDVFYDQDSLAMHVMSKHSQEAPRTSEPSPHRTGSSHPQGSLPVGNTTKYPPTYPTHRLLSIQADLLVCDYCGQSFVNRDALAMHVLSHTRASEPRAMFRFHQDNTVLDYLRMARLREAASLASLRKLSERHRNLSTEEPLNLVSEMKFDLTKNGNRIESDSIDLTKSREDLKQRNVNRTENESSNANEKENSKDRGSSFSAHGSYVVDSAPRCSSAPTSKCDVTSYVERAASTGCLPSDGYMRDLATSSIIPQENEEKQQIIAEERSTCKLPVVGISNQQKLVPLNLLDTEKPIRLGEMCPELALQTDESERQHIVELMLKNKNIHMCRYCEIIFPSRTLYYLHMGLHNHNRPLQCNMCGKLCENVNDFNAHVIHI